MHKLGVSKDMRYDVPAVRQVIRLIELLCESDKPLGVSQIREALGTNKSMVFRLLQTLHREGWIIRKEDGPTYQLGLRPFHYLSKPVARMSLIAAAAGPLQALWRATGESVYLGVLDGDRVLYLEHVDGTGPVHIAGRVGGRYYLHCSAPGKVLLAHAGDALVDVLADKGLEPQTRHSIQRPGPLREDLERVRARGFAVDYEEYAEGVLCFAAPIRDYTGTVRATIGVSVLTLHYTAERMEAELGPRVLEASRAISLDLGHQETTRAAASR